MFQTTSLSDTFECVLNTMRLLELGRLEGDKGHSSFDTKTKSFQQCRFCVKTEKSLEHKDSKGQEKQTACEDASP
jgi:hypothetical protein